MSRVTITVSAKTKKLLDSLRKGREWDEFLRELARTAMREKKRKALERLKKLVSKSDLEKLESILGEVRINWRLQAP